MKKTMLKKVLSLVMAMVMCLGLVACGAASTTPPAKEEKPAQESTTPEEKPAEKEDDGWYETPEIVIRCATGTSPTMPATAAVQKWCETITERTKNRISVEFYPNRALGADADIIPQVMNGTIEMCLMSLSNVSSFTTLLDCVQTPFLLTDYNKMEAAYKSDELRTLLDAAGEATGLTMLSIYEYGIRHIANNVRPIETMDDLSGLKIRAVTSQMIVDCLSSIGANATPLGYSEVYSALESNVIDGEEINYTSVWSEKHYEVVKYFTEIGLWPYPGILVVNEAFFETLSAEDQQLFWDVAAECLDYNIESILEIEETAIAGMTEAGVEVNEIADKTPLVEATAHIRDQLAASDERVAAFIDMAAAIK